MTRSDFENVLKMGENVCVEFKRGFSKTNLIYMRKFYLVFRKSQTVSDLLSWSHYMELLRITDSLEMQFYCAECIRSNWNVQPSSNPSSPPLPCRRLLTHGRTNGLTLTRVIRGRFVSIVTR